MRVDEVVRQVLPDDYGQHQARFRHVERHLARDLVHLMMMRLLGAFLVTRLIVFSGAASGLLMPLAARLMHLHLLHASSLWQLVLGVDFRHPL